MGMPCFQVREATHSADDDKARFLRQGGRSGAPNIGGTLGRLLGAAAVAATVLLAGAGVAAASPIDRSYTPPESGWSPECLRPQFFSNRYPHVASDGSLRSLTYTHNYCDSTWEGVNHDDGNLLIIAEGRAEISAPIGYSSHYRIGDEVFDLRYENDGYATALSSLQGFGELGLVITRLFPDGTADRSFDNESSDEYPHGAPGSQILASGWLWGEQWENWLAVEAAFSDDGIVVLYQEYSDSDWNNPIPSSDLRLAKFTLDGEPLGEPGHAGVVPGGSEVSLFTELAVGKDGSVLVTWIPEGDGDMEIVRFFADGSRDMQFGEAGGLSYSEWGTFVSSDELFAVMRLDPGSTTIDFSTTWTVYAWDGSVLLTSALPGLGGTQIRAIDSEGRLWLAEGADLMRLTRDFEPDPTFGGDGTVSLAGLSDPESGYSLGDLDNRARMWLWRDEVDFGPPKYLLLENPPPDLDFADDDGSVFEADIEALAAAGITRGCNPPINDRFCPDDPVTRGQMAAFLHRALPSLEEKSTSTPFVDSRGSVFEADIAWLSATGITRGCNPPGNDRFCPDEPVTRGEMAAFLVRGLKYADDGGGDLFIDDDNSVFEADIDRLGTAGVTRGCNPPTNNEFCPDDPVTRGQMAAFLVRALSLRS